LISAAAKQRAARPITNLQSEIVGQLRGTEFEKQFRTIQTHLKKMESCGIIEINKDKKDLTVVSAEEKDRDFCRRCIVNVNK